jgi:hypothetical protein
MERFSPGQTVVLRGFGRVDVSVSRALAGIVIEDADSGLVVFTPGETRYKDRFRGSYDVGTPAAEPGYLDRAWGGRHTVRVYLPSEPFSVWWFFSSSFQFIGWYGDLHTPFVRTPIGIDARDHCLDVVASADGTWAWKDEAAFARRLETGVDSERHQAAVRAAGRAFVDRLTTRAAPFDRRWEDWRPPPDWTARELPSTWLDDYGTRPHFPPTNL